MTVGRPTSLPPNGHHGWAPLPVMACHSCKLPSSPDALQLHGMCKPMPALRLPFPLANQMCSPQRLSAQRLSRRNHHAPTSRHRWRTHGPSSPPPALPADRCSHATFPQRLQHLSFKSAERQTKHAPLMPPTHCLFHSSQPPPLPACSICPSRTSRLRGRARTICSCHKVPVSSKPPPFPARSTCPLRTSRPLGRARMTWWL